MGSDWFTVQTIASDIYAIDDHGNSLIYLVVGSMRALLIDTGWGIGKLRELVAGITGLPLTVVNTHGHPDHVGGDAQFETVHIAAADIPILEGCFMQAHRQWDLEHGISGPYPQDFNPEKWLHSKPGRVTAVKANHRFDLGNKEIEVVGLPGRSPGGIALLDPEARMLFSGDSVLAGNVWMHLEHSTPLDVYLNSLKELHAQISRFDFILPGHGQTPIEAGITAELMDGTERIIQGKIKGKPHPTFAGEGLLCTFDQCGIVYDENKLLEN